MNHLDNFVSMLIQRLGPDDARALKCIDRASHLIVFGSMSVGLGTPHSDLDILCVTKEDYTLKTPVLDLLCISENMVAGETWKRGELASHIACYGTLLRGDPNWALGIRLGGEAVTKKERRVRAFLQHLPQSWLELEECFKVKYAKKVRREVQRLILLGQDIPIPPTLILDQLWIRFPEKHGIVKSYIENVTSNTGKGNFDLMTWIENPLNRDSLDYNTLNHPAFDQAASVLLS